MTSFGRRGAGLGLALTLAGAGCGVAKERGHDDVAALVKERTGRSTRWERGTPEADQIERWVSERLAKGVTRDAAVDVALVNNPRLQEAYEELGVAQADLVQAGLLENPSLGAHVGFPVRGDGREISFSLVQSFLDVIVLPARKRIAAEQFAIDVRRVAERALETVADVEKEVVAVEAAAAIVDVRRAALDAAGGAAELSRQQHEAGSVSDLKNATQLVLPEEIAVDLARDELELVRHRERLGRLLGLGAARAEWRLAEALGDPPASDPAVGDLEALALRRRLDVDAARRRQKLLGRAVGLARSTRLVGRLEVGLDAHQDADGPRVLGPNLVIELPIFDQRQALIGRLEAEERAAGRRVAALEGEARAEVRVARAELAAARAVVDRYGKTIIPLRDQIVDEAQLHYNGMLLGLYQLVDLKREQIEARARQLAAVRDYWTARVELERAVGGRIPTGGAK
jgi:cobalt-zinc-cadmium efflux system outer membrane protein